MAKKKIGDIEVLRAVAVLLVVVHHAYHNLIPWSTPTLDLVFSLLGGWAGVDLFFVISGFVIARDLLPRLNRIDDKEAFFYACGAFWIRRFWRLAPTAWLWLLLILVLSLFFNSSGAFGTFRSNFEGGVAAFLNVANLHLAMVRGQVSNANFHFWSLSLEEQFYILLPIAIFVFKRSFVYLVVAIVVYQLVVTRIGIYAWMLRAAALMLGVLLAIWSKHATYRLFEPIFMRKKSALSILFLLVMLAALASVGSPGLKVIENKVGLIAVIAAILVFVASFDRNYILSEGRVKNVAMWIGARSYAIYVIHIPAFYFTREIWFRLDPPNSMQFDSSYAIRFSITAAVLIIVVSELNFRYLEMPLRRKGVNIANRFAAKELVKSKMPGASPNG